MINTFGSRSIGSTHDIWHNPSWLKNDNFFVLDPSRSCNTKTWFANVSILLRHVAILLGGTNYTRSKKSETQKTCFKEYGDHAIIVVTIVKKYLRDVVEYATRSRAQKADRKKADQNIWLVCKHVHCRYPQRNLFRIATISGSRIIEQKEIHR